MAPPLFPFYNAAVPVLDDFSRISRRTALAGMGALGAAGWSRRSCSEPISAEPASAADDAQALVAITLDLEMSRNFPNWEDTHWDYEKGNLTDEVKQYAVEACGRVHARGGRVHNFVVGQVFEQQDVDWLKEIARQGHPIGNHTYDHVYVLAQDLNQLQYRFRRAPWLIQGLTTEEVIRRNIAMTSKALQQRVGVQARGFRTPGGFAMGLTGHEDIQRMLLDLGFTWASSRYVSHGGVRDLHTTGEPPSREVFLNIVAAQKRSQPDVYPTGLIEIPMSPISDIGAFRNGRWKLKHFLKAIRMALDWVIEHKAVFDFLAHPSCLGVVDPKFQTIDMICSIVEQSRGRAALVDLDVVAGRVPRP